MEVLIKVLQLILSLSLLVFVHELGHYLTSRMFGIRVEKFYLFFDAGGFSIFKFKIGETTFGLGWVPFGGYCKISGMIDESMDTEAMKKPAEPWEFRSKPAWQRLIVMVGGVVMNIITACVIYIGMSWHWGDEYIDNGDLKWGYAFNEFAHEIGFENGDRVVGFDGVPVTGDFAKVYSDMVIERVKRVDILRDGESALVTIPEEAVARMLDTPGFMLPRTPFVIGAIAPGLGAERAGLAVGDSLVSLNGAALPFFDQWGRALEELAGSTVDVTFERDSAGMRVPMVLSVQVSEEGKLGVNPFAPDRFFPVHTIDYNFSQAVGAGFREAGAQIAGYWKQLKMIFNPKTEAYKSVGSLIAIGNFFPGQWNWYMFWYFTAFLSIILAVMNMLPIPALDGGHTLFLLWEVVTRRKPSDKFLERAQIVGMVLLLLLLVFTFGNDIYRFFIK